MDVLDLFAGSGLVAREVLARQQSWRIFCVDNAISSADVGAQQLSNVIWLKTDVRSVCSDLLAGRKFDLVCMDPPHGALLDLLYELDESNRTLLHRVSEVAPWLVIYQGHVSQSGRAIAIRRTLRSHYDKVRVWRLGSESILITGPKDQLNIHSGKKETFEQISQRILGRLEDDCKQFGWSVENR